MELAISACPTGRTGVQPIPHTSSPQCRIRSRGQSYHIPERWAPSFLPLLAPFDFRPAHPRFVCATVILPLQLQFLLVDVELVRLLVLDASHDTVRVRHEGHLQLAQNAEHDVASGATGLKVSSLTQRTLIMGSSFSFFLPLSLRIVDFIL